MIKIYAEVLKRNPVWTGGVLLTLMLTSVALRLVLTSTPEPEPEPAKLPANTELEPEPAPQIIERVEVLKRNSTLQDILLRVGLTHRDIYELVTATKPVFNLHRLRAGNKLTLESDLDGSFRGLRYEISAEEYLTTRFDGQDYHAEKVTYPIETQVVTLAGQIEYSMWQTILDLDEDPRLVASLLAILQWDVDFTVLQPQDWFKLLVEKRFREQQFIGYGALYAVQLHTGGRNYNGFYFEEPGKKGRHFDEKGIALRKAFLKIPFTYAPRISSRFSYSRLHPILKTRRPHPAIDFAAPRGTPVLASGNGKVIQAGPNGGLGKFVQIQHSNGYKSGYAHLSKILVKNGQRVSQGQRIGLVGSTGLATAAHLDYRIWDPKGRYVNPRKRVSWPSAEDPVDKQYWEQFEILRNTLLAELDQMPVESFKGKASLFKAD